MLKLRHFEKATQILTFTHERQNVECFFFNFFWPFQKTELKLEERNHFQFN